MLPVWPRVELSGGVSGAIVSGSLSLPHSCTRRWGKVYSQLQSAMKTSRARCPDCLTHREQTKVPGPGQPQNGLCFPTVRVGLR